MTKTPARKIWNAPELVHLGRIADVAGVITTTVVEAATQRRS